MAYRRNNLCSNSKRHHQRCRGGLHPPVDVTSAHAAPLQCRRSGIGLNGRNASLRGQRSSLGSVMPFVAVSVIFMLGTVGIVTELTRVFETVRQLKFSAQATALYGLSLSTNSDGSYSTSAAQTNIQTAIANASAAAWNSAQCGPVGNIFASGSLSRTSIAWSNSVSFAQSDINFVNNPLNANEFFVQLSTASWAGNNPLQQFLLPLLWLYTNPIGSRLAASEYTASAPQTIEVIGQPASRIGPAAPLGSQSGTRAGDLVGFAALPLAISNLQFASIANPAQTPVPNALTIDLVASNSAEYGGTAPAGHVKGCLVNVYGTGTNGSYYGNGSGNTAINQLIALLGYFSGINAQAAITPAVVEEGSQLNGYNPADPTLSASQTNNITKAISQLPLGGYYIVPVISGDPSFSNTNTVAGFARLQLASIAPTKGIVTSLTMNIPQSVPVRNASSATGYSSIPGQSTTLMPAPVYPFTPRQYDSSSGGVTVSPLGVVLAPALSCRPPGF